MLKRITVICLVIIMMASVGIVAFATEMETDGSELLGSNSKAFSQMTEEQLTPYFAVAQSMVETYYLATMSEDSIFSKTISSKATSKPLQTANRINEFLESKLEYETYYMRELGYSKTYLNGTYDLLDWHITDDSLWCEIAAKVTFKYSDFDQHSEIGDVIQIVIENVDAPIITDFYNDSPDSFDTQIRGYDLDLRLSTDRISNQNAAEISEKVNTHLDGLEQSGTLMKEDVDIDVDFSQRITIVPQAVSTRRQNAANWALNNCSKATPTAGSSTVPWTSVLDPGCTNFTSHALLAGGYSVKPGTHLGPSDDCWFYVSMSNRSASWGGVTNFFNFVTWNNSQSNSAPKATSTFSNSNYPFIMYPKTIATLDVGDIIQIKFNTSGSYAYPNYGHNLMMTGESNYQGSLSYIMITGRTRANQYKKNVKLNDAYPPAPNTNNGSGNHLYRGIKLSY